MIVRQEVLTETEGTFHNAKKNQLIKKSQQS